MKKFLVITTINAPTKAIYKFLKVLSNDWKIIIVGDRKGPFEYIEDEKIIFLDIETQYRLYPEFSRSIPEKHYSRKNIGYYHAIKLGADFIAETDDDNIPYDFFPQFIDDKEINVNVVDLEGSVNIYSYFTDKHIWPRGLDLTKINQKISEKALTINKVKPFIQQGLADKDPDVDAIYRLAIYDEVYFDQGKSIALGQKSRSPFNTQNTYWHKEAFPLLFIPTTVKSRICDIWKSYIAQKGIQSIGGSIVFQSPTVYQERNEHNLQMDFNEEIPLYTQVSSLVELLLPIPLETGSVVETIKHIYKVLVDEGILLQQDLNALSLWLEQF